MENMGGVNNFKAMGDFLGFYKQQLEETKNNDYFKTPLVGGISKDQILGNDQELAQDLKVLMKDDPFKAFLEQNPQAAKQLSSGDVANAFSKVMDNYMNDVNNKQKDSEVAMETFASGGKIDIHSVMISAEKASLAMQLTMQMRNKLLTAYQEVSRMVH